MTLLLIENLEKRNANTIIFPSFNFTMEASTVAAFHCHVNVREMLVHILEGSFHPSGGQVTVNGTLLHERNFRFQASVCSLYEGVYERLTVRDHLNFYKEIYSSLLTIEESAAILSLKDILNVPISKCSKSEVKRVQFSRVLYADSKLIVFEEPIQNTDLETQRIFMNFVQYLTTKGKAILILTGDMQSAFTVTERVYRLGEEGLFPYDVETEVDSSEQEPEMKEGTTEEAVIQPVRFEKIPAKVQDKIILFSPMEIDYIESGEGSANIMIDGETYPSDFKMTELEERLLPYGFFRCHRSYIVNLQRVREVITWTRNSYSLVLDDRNKTSIPLSKTKMTDLKGMIGLK